MAHDLRTPLQAFQSELEHLRDNIRHEGSSKSGMHLKCIKQLERIINFMTMTINRSIDFTKASSGITLNPSIESINLAETVKWAVGCMVTPHMKVPIVIAPIPKAIHNQCYTDKQWLMENLLCLLSNAQKFTTEGNITIRCSLQSSLQRSVIQITKLFDKSDDVAEGKLGEDRDVEAGMPEQVGLAAPMLLIEVEDTGIGISKENQERLFKPFMQVQTILIDARCDAVLYCCDLMQLLFCAVLCCAVICCAVCVLYAFPGSAKNWRHWARAVLSLEAHGKSGRELRRRG